MINWTEEDVKFVVTNMIIPCMTEFQGGQLKYEGKITESYNRILDNIATKIQEISYNQQRDTMYFLSFLSQKFGYSLESLKMSHKEYCEEFDKLNKHLLEEKVMDDAIYVNGLCKIDNTGTYIEDSNGNWKNIIDFMNTAYPTYEQLYYFYSYFQNLYGQGLEIANWHLNGDLEPFDTFFEEAAGDFL